MSTGQTLLTLGALLILTTIMLNFYRIFGSSWDTLDGAQLGIDATTIATSYMEVANGLVIDEAVLDSNLIVEEDKEMYEYFKEYWEFGPPEGVTDISEFFAFDHFHGVRDTTTVTGLGTYVTEFEVYYVSPINVQLPVYVMQTYAKRMDMKIWRLDPPPPANAGVDTVQMWTVMGYFNYQ